MAKTSTRHPHSLAAAALIIIAASVIPGYRSPAQEIHPSMSHAIGAERTVPLRPRAVAAAPETLRVLVARVDFVADTEPRTTGTGKFDLTQPTRPIIDPPPHDSAYAGQHMTFLENYYRKSSGGKMIVVGTVLDSVSHLPYPMAHYSPLRSSTNNAELGALVTDVWHTVDSLTPGLPFQSYNAFMIFHAGVGRDIDLASVLGYDPGPFDIPSVYMDSSSLRKIYGASYPGVSVQGGSTYITNSLIIPETESRLISTGGGSVLLELGINGLVVASIGSHLGLPDLFNTRNGRSGIGRFGLMDGQSIFSWSGIFPPEPSAWEKYFLGWISPIVAGAGTVTYSLPAAASASVDSVLRVPISGKEYFLVENRNRDANRDGSTATVVRNGSVVQQTYMRDTTNYNAYDVDSLYGVVIDVDEFDWSLPGITTNDGTLYDGGILIWHIDENVIDANIEADAVNANANRRGVNLMEADGSQDIGQSYDLIHPGYGSEDGTYLDYWYHGNTATPRTFVNEFTPNSAPNSLSNDFANSHVYVREFSDRGPRMSVTVRVGDEQIAPLPGFPKNLGSSPGMSSVLPADLDGDGVAEFVVGVTGKKSYSDSIPHPDGAILAFRQSGTSFLLSSDSSGTFIRDSSNSFDPPVAFNFNGDGRDDIATMRHPSAPGYTNAQPRIFSPLDANFDGLADVIWGTGFGGINSTAAVLPFAAAASDSAVVWGGTGRHLLLFADTTQVHSSGSSYSALASEGNGTSFYGFDFYNAIEKFAPPPAPTGRIVLPTALSGSPALGDLDGDGRIWLAALGRDGSVYVVDTSFQSREKFPFSIGTPISSSPAMGDVDGDGRKDIVLTAGANVYALNSAAASLDNFPISVRTSFPITSSPVLADIDGDGKVDILVVTQEGRFFAYNTRGKVLPGFPLQIGGNVLTSVTVFRTTAGNVGIAAASEDHFLYAWETKARFDSTPHPWPMYLHDARHSGFEDLTSPGIAAGGDFLPAPRAYNWPNPVTSADGFRTHIRYYVAQDARVTVKIFDMAGDLVTELRGNGIGGLDNELEWDVAGIQSGVYFGHIEAEGTGANGHAVIKIAVVK